MRRDEIIARLRQLEKMRLQVEAMDRALEQLNEEECNIIATLYLHPKRNNIEYLCEKLEIERTTVYRRRNKALKKLGNILEK